MKVFLLNPQGNKVTLEDCWFSLCWPTKTCWKNEEKEEEYRVFFPNTNSVRRCQSLIKTSAVLRFTQNMQCVPKAAPVESIFLQGIRMAAFQWFRRLEINSFKRLLKFLFQVLPQFAPNGYCSFDIKVPRQIFLFSFFFFFTISYLFDPRWNWFFVNSWWFLQWWSKLFLTVLTFKSGKILP